MNQILYFWRLGWVAFVTVVICAIGFNAIGRLALVIAGIDHQQPLTSQLMVLVPAFLIFGLPFAGWMFSLAIKKAHVLTSPNRTIKSNETTNP